MSDEKVLGRLERAVAAKALKDNPLWPEMVRLVQGQIMLNWASSNGLEAREEAWAQFCAVGIVIQALQRSASQAHDAAAGVEGRRIGAG